MGRAPEGTILVADDNDANRDLVVSLLGAEGYQVLSVTDGKQALDRISADSIDLALQVPLTARILQVTDVYDALTTDRPYRKALSPQKAFEIIREGAKRGWWDMSAVNEFEAVVHGYEPVQPAKGPIPVKPFEMKNRDH